MTDDEIREEFRRAKAEFVGVEFEPDGTLEELIEQVIEVEQIMGLHATQIDR